MRTDRLTKTIKNTVDLQERINKKHRASIFEYLNELLLIPAIVAVSRVQISR